MPTDNVSIVFDGLDVALKVSKMQDDLKTATGFDTHMACPACKEQVGKKNYCKNPECEKHTGLEQKETLTYFGKDYEAGKTKTFGKAEVESCKEVSKKELVFVQKEPKNFDRRRILSCHYVSPRPNKDDSSALDKYELLFRGLQYGDHALGITMGRTGSDQLGILTVEEFDKPMMVLYTVCHSDQIRAVPEVPAFDESKAEEYGKVGKEFLDNLENNAVGLEDIKSQTIENYKLLQAGNMVIVEKEKKERSSESAMDIFKKATKKKQ